MIDTTDLLARALRCGLDIRFLIQRIGAGGDNPAVDTIKRACTELEKEMKLVVRDEKTFTEAE